MTLQENLNQKKKKYLSLNFKVLLITSLDMYSKEKFALNYKLLHDNIIQSNYKLDGILSFLF